MECGLLALQLGLAGDQLRFLRVDVADARRELRGRPIPPVGFALELVGTRVELRLQALQLHLACVELLRTRLHQLFACRPHRREVLLALFERILLRRDLHADLLELALPRRQLLLAPAKLVGRGVDLALQPRDVVGRDRPRVEPRRALAQVALELGQIVLAGVEL